MTRVMPLLRPMWVTMALLFALAVVLHSLAGTARAQPKLTESNPKEGEALPKPPGTISLCFSEPVVSQDSDTFRFSLRAPDGGGLGLRIVFQPLNKCAEVQHGHASGVERGVWTLEWQVTSLATGDPSSGTLHFSVAGGAGPTPVPTLTVTPSDASPSAGTATPRPEPTVTPGPGSAGDDSDQDILTVALITTAAMVGAAVLGLVAYALRVRIGFWLHRPPAEPDDGPEHR